MATKIVSKNSKNKLEESRADKYIQSIGSWIVEWMATYIDEFPNSSDSEFFKSSLSHLERKGYISRKQLDVIGSAWNECQDAWPEFKERAAERNPFKSE